MESLIEFVLENVNYEEYYKKEFEGWDGNCNSNVECIFHKDTGRPNLSLNIKGTGGAYCHSCGKRIGSIIHFEKEKAALETDEEAAAAIYSRLIRPVLAPDKDYLKLYLTALKGAPLIQKKIQNEIQITEQTIERFSLGWDSQSRRMVIPILDIWGQILNIRSYRLPSMRENEEYPKLLNTDGYGSPAELFPKPQLFSLCSGRHKPTTVYWFSGERDTLLAWDRGIPSFCYTTGEQTCKPEWITEIKKLDVQIAVVADNDKVGWDAGRRRIIALEAQGIKNFLVQFDKKEIKDFSDYILSGKTIKDFLVLESDNSTEEKEDEIISEDIDFMPKIVDPTTNKHLGEHAVAEIGRNPKILNHPMSTKGIVSGKLDKTFAVPWMIQVGEKIYKMPICRELIEFIRANDQDIEKLIKYWINTKARIKVLDRITVTEIEIIPMIQPGVETFYVNQRCYFFGDYIECNKPYLMEIIATTVMSSQETVGLVISVEPTSNILDSYKFNEHSCQTLQNEFNIGIGDSYDALKELANQIAIKHTHIYNRNDLHICGLLTWLSPLQFKFPEEGIRRGWLNTLVLGDTETGKSEVCKHLTNLFHSGVFINAESCSYVGLVGGAVKRPGDCMILRWGKIPLYNKQLVVIEELSGLSTQEISNMSEIRSAGVARYDKAGLSGETQAKTRLICLSNVRGGQKSLGDYNTGVQAAQELVGQNEDLARFDLILTATDDEVDNKVINQDRTQTEKESFSSVELQAFKELVMFAWSLKPEQIDFTVAAYRQCLIQTLKFSGDYHSSLPIFKGSSGRLKLARVACAIACIQFNWNFETEKLMVEPKHVDAAVKVFQHLYAKPSFGYARYSKIQYMLQRVVDEDKAISTIDKQFNGTQRSFLEYLSNSLSFNKFEIAEAFGKHHMFVDRVISQMFLSNLLKKGDNKFKSEWQLSRAGRKWVEKRLTQHN